MADEDDNIASFYGEPGPAPDPLEPFDISSLDPGGPDDPEPKAVELHRDDPRYDHPVLGPFIKSEGDSWEYNKAFIQREGLQFNPYAYEFFDGQIAVSAGKDIAKKLMSDDPKYDDLRMNLAVMRNYLFNNYFPTGQENRDPQDKAVKFVDQMAKDIGLMLKRGKNVLHNPLEPSISLSLANEEAVGGAEIYSRLKAKSDSYKRTGLAHSFINLLSGKDSHNWDLPPLSDTPFSKVNRISDAGDPEFIDYTYEDTNYAEQEYLAEEAARQAVYANLMAQQDVAALAELGQVEEGAQELGDIQMQLNTVEDLNKDVQEEAITEARNILDKLKVHFSAFSVEQLLDNFDQPIVQELFNKMSDVSSIFRHHLDVAVQLDENIEQNELVREALHALEILQYHELNHQAAQMQNSAIAYEAAQDVDQAKLAMKECDKLVAAANNMPDSCKHSGDVTVGALLERVERGLDAVVEHVQDITQTQNQLGKANELALGLREFQPAANSAKEDKRAEDIDENKNLAKKDAKIDGMQAVRAQMLLRQKEKQNQMDEATGKGKNNIVSAKGLRGKGKNNIVGTAGKLGQQKTNMASLVADMKLDAITEAQFDGTGDALKPFNVNSFVQQKAQSNTRKGVLTEMASEKRTDDIAEINETRKPNGPSR